MITMMYFIKVSPFGSKVKIKPYRPTATEFALFRHCADGMSEVYENYFISTVTPLLMQHGVEDWNFIEEGTEVPNG